MRNHLNAHTFYQEVLRRVKSALRAITLVWHVSPGWTLAWGIMLLVSSILPAALVILTKRIVDVLVAAISSSGDTELVSQLIVLGVVAGSIMLLQQALQQALSWVQTLQGELVQDHVKTLIHKKAVAVDYGFYESSEYFDQLQQASTQAGPRSLALMQNAGAVLQNTLTFLSIIVIVASYSLWVPFVLVVGMLPAVVVVIRHNRKYYKWWKERTRENRWIYYLDVLFIEPRFAAEMRLYNLGDHFQEEYQRAREVVREERMHLLRKNAVAKMLAALLGVVVVGIIMAWMIWRALKGAATPGDIALFYQAIQQSQGLIRTVLNGLGEVYTSTLYVEQLFSFLDRENQLVESETSEVVPERLRKGIRFEEVTFTYPGAEQAAVKNLNLEMAAGQVVALVGANGAGKSTITKLLCRFYDPDQGRILIDGQNLKSFAKAQLRESIAIIFQMPVHFQGTAHENIVLGDQKATKERVVEAAKEAGAHDFIERLPDGYGTILGRLFPNGTDLSGGQWQKVALARAFIRESPIVVLDEPTSFMDSWAENEWLGRFRKWVAGRTALIITHRFSTAMQADIIHVMDNGQIIESGTHAELLALDGHYAVSWRTQMRTGSETSTDVI